MYIYICMYICNRSYNIWWFPKIGLPPNHHPFTDGFSATVHSTRCPAVAQLRPPGASEDSMGPFVGPTNARIGGKTCWKNG